MSYGVGCRHGSQVAVVVVSASPAAPISPLTWELPYASSAALKKKKKINSVIPKLIIYGKLEIDIRNIF